MPVREESSVGTKLLFISSADVARCGVTLEQLESEIKAGFREKTLGQVESPPKRGVVPRPDSSIRAMMAHVPRQRAAGIKWVSAFPENVRRGIPTISGLITLNSVETGLPKAVMDAAWITAMRTAACTVVAARYLARASSETIGIIGCGTQGQSNLDALCRYFPIGRVNAYDLVPLHAANFAAKMRESLGVDVEPVPYAEDAVRGMDIVVTSAPVRKRPASPISSRVLEPGAWACALDYDATFGGTAMEEVDRIVVDDLDQLNFFRSIGYFRRTPRPHSELGSIVAGRVPGRGAEHERILSLNLGIGFLDILAAELVYRQALQRELGVWLEV
jgi:ornithine cyclodeaminase/alanine dehydrogenase